MTYTKALLIALLLSLPLSVGAEENSTTEPYTKLPYGISDGSSTTTASCVTKKDVLDAIDVLVPKPDPGVTIAVCDPCSCGSQYGDAACYQWIANNAKAKEEREAKARDVIERFDKVGLCK